jgi:hypothetical protein
MIQRTFRAHGLSIVTVGIFALWFVLYWFSDPNTHLGQFFGNAIADWSGSVVIILGTKFLLERGSHESKKVARRHGGFAGFCHAHSLLIFLAITGVVWAVVFWHSPTNSKWGQVYGNILSEWIQMAGLVFLTKSLIERGSTESKQRA